MFHKISIGPFFCHHGIEGTKGLKFKPTYHTNESTQMKEEVYYGSKIIRSLNPCITQMKESCKILF
jgi:hypothetical protein